MPRVASWVKEILRGAGFRFFAILENHLEDYFLKADYEPVDFEDNEDLQELIRKTALGVKAMAQRKRVRKWPVSIGEFAFMDIVPPSAHPGGLDSISQLRQLGMHYEEFNRIRARFLNQLQLEINALPPPKLTRPRRRKTKSKSSSRSTSRSRSRSKPKSRSRSL